MTFDVNSFRKAKFTQREKDVTLKGLADAGFGDGVFRIRGLTAAELAEAESAGDKSKMLAKLVERLAGSDAEKVDALMDGMGMGKDTPANLAKKITHVQAGIIEPAMEIKDVVKLGEAFPIEFGMLANEIYGLTGMGQVAQVKQKPSGKTPASKQA